MRSSDPKVNVLIFLIIELCGLLQTAKSWMDLQLLIRTCIEFHFRTFRLLIWTMVELSLFRIMRSVKSFNKFFFFFGCKFKF